jgi:hypothetical protein
MSDYAAVVKTPHHQTVLHPQNVTLGSYLVSWTSAFNNLPLTLSFFFSYLRSKDMFIFVFRRYLEGLGLLGILESSSGVVMCQIYKLLQDALCESERGNFFLAFLTFWTYIRKFFLV